jgi:hypothetical protein
MNAKPEKWHDLSATFSVKDHTVPGAFIAEVLLYDRLVIPIPPRISERVSKELAEKEWKRWVAEKWDPARQTQLIGILRDKLGDERVIQVPWTLDLQAEWERRMTSAQGDTDKTFQGAVGASLKQARRDGYFKTGEVLEGWVPAMSKAVVAVSTFRSLQDLKKSTGICSAPPQPVPKENLMAVLGFELFVPNDPDRKDYDLLSEAASVAADTNYRRKRTALYRWQEQFIRNGLTDEPSVKKAVKEMRDLVNDLNKETKWKWVRQVLSFFKVGKEVAKIVHPGAGDAAEVIISGGDFIVDHALGDVEPDLLGKPAAALVLDAQKRLGLKMTKEGRVSLKSAKG